MNEFLIAGCCVCFVFWMCWKICSELQTDPGGKYLRGLYPGLLFLLLFACLQTV